MGKFRILASFYPVESFLSMSNVKGRKLEKSRENHQTLNYYATVLLGAYTKTHSEKIVRDCTQRRHEFANVKRQSVHQHEV